MNIDMKAWPVLIISSQFDAPNDEGLILWALMGHLQEEKVSVFNHRLVMRMVLRFLCLSQILVPFLSIGI